MGCDIHSYAEKRINGKWESVGFSPFNWRQYGMYGFLANVRNYSAVPPLAEQRGLPADISSEVREEADTWSGDAHSHSWLSTAELTAFDYDAKVEDRRVTRQVGPNAWDGGQTCAPGEGETETWREFLGPEFFRDLDRLREYGLDTRVVFWFDN